MYGSSRVILALCIFLTLAESAIMGVIFALPVQAGVARTFSSSLHYVLRMTEICSHKWAGARCLYLRWLWSIQSPLDFVHLDADACRRQHFTVSKSLQRHTELPHRDVYHWIRTWFDSFSATRFCVVLCCVSDTKNIRMHSSSTDTAYII